MKTERLIGLDIFRVIAALAVFFFHSLIHIGCRFGFLSDFFEMGAIFMTGFFILSGYGIYTSNVKKDLTRLGEIKGFYKKRAISILPAYYVVAILYVFYPGTETAVQAAELAPVQIFGLQSVFSSLFYVSHNGGTWFVSCILICYLVYPFIQEVTKQISTRSKWILIVLAVCILLYAPIVVKHFGLKTIYSNPFFRLAEFSIGVFLAALKEKLDEKKAMRLLYNWPAFFVEFALLIAGVTFAMKRRYEVANYMMYGQIALPIFILMTITLSGVRCAFLERSRLLKYACKISYVFFFAQFFTWPLTRLVLQALGRDGNKTKLVVSFTICLLIAIVLHELVERPVKYLFSRTAKQKMPKA